MQLLFLIEAIDHDLHLFPANWIHAHENDFFWKVLGVFFKPTNYSVASFPGVLISKVVVQKKHIPRASFQRSDTSVVGACCFCHVECAKIVDQ